MDHPTRAKPQYLCVSSLSPHNANRLIFHRISPTEKPNIFWTSTSRTDRTPVGYQTKLVVSNILTDYQLEFGQPNTGRHCRWFFNKVISCSHAENS